MRAAAVLFAFALSACGEAKEEDASSGDVTRQSGGFTLNVTAAEPAFAAGRTCPGGGTYTIGSPPPTPSTPGGLVEDLDGGASIFCVVAPKDGAFYVDVSAAFHANTPEGLSIQILKDGVDEVNGSTSLGLNIHTPPTGIMIERPDDSCALGPIRELSPGAIYADFSCPLVAGLMDDTLGCAANGTIEFRQCVSELDN